MSGWQKPEELESSIEREGSNYALRRGWIEYKVVSPSRRGFPDRFYARNSRIVLVEWKRPGEEPTIQQARRHRELRAAGVEVHWLDNMDDARELFY